MGNGQSQDKTEEELRDSGHENPGDEQESSGQSPDKSAEGLRNSEKERLFDKQGGPPPQQTQTAPGNLHRALQQYQAREELEEAGLLPRMAESAVKRTTSGDGERERSQSDDQKSNEVAPTPHPPNVEIDMPEAFDGAQGKPSPAPAHISIPSLSPPEAGEEKELESWVMPPPPTMMSLGAKNSWALQSQLASEIQVIDASSPRESVEDSHSTSGGDSSSASVYLTEHSPLQPAGNSSAGSSAIDSLTSERNLALRDGSKTLSPRQLNSPTVSEHEQAAQIMGTLEDGLSSTGSVTYLPHVEMYESRNSIDQPLGTEAVSRGSRNSWRTLAQGAVEKAAALGKPKGLSGGEVLREIAADIGDDEFSRLLDEIAEELEVAGTKAYLRTS